MAENILPPRIKFFQNHRPAMDLGEYTLTIKSSITHDKITGKGHNTASLTQRFAVYGERFSLNDQDIRGVFPAAGSTGEYSSILPHVILHRNTLPWERHALATNHDLPWLALLLFDENETPEKKVVTVEDLKTLPTEVAQNDDEKVTVIDVPKNVLEKILPPTTNLILLAHTRQGINDRHESVGEENAVVFCNRLPEQGKRSTMHLVSVEGRYNEHGFVFPTEGDQRLVSLKSWEFYSIEHFKITTATLEALKDNAPETDIDKISTLLDREFAGTESNFLEDVAKAVGLEEVPDGYKNDLIQNAKFDKTFDGLLMNLNKDILTLRLPPKNEIAEQYLSQGLTPLVHYFRNGDRSVSWYRGPFVPLASSADGSEVRDLNPETADELVRFDADRGMFDVTYSAAWEIGRLLALASKDFSVSLFQWKRLIAQHKHKEDQKVGTEHLPSFAHSHNHELEAPLWERHVQPWLNQLASLQNIPANYLVPEEQLLPQESIRFFYVDKNWLVAALSGAYSVGGDLDRTSRTQPNNFTQYLASNLTYVMGFILRSDVVNGWPGLLIDGWTNLSDGGIKTRESKKHTPLRRQLSRDVLLCLFKAEIEQVEFHQKPEVMHFGLLKENNTFRKKVRNSDGEEVGDPLPVTWQSEERRVIDMDQLATALGKAGKPAQFAMNMIEGVPKVIFRLSV